MDLCLLICKMRLTIKTILMWSQGGLWEVMHVAQGQARGQVWKRGSCSYSMVAVDVRRGGV